VEENWIELALAEERNSDQNDDELSLIKTSGADPTKPSPKL
jgi:hypothetical protein